MEAQTRTSRGHWARWVLLFMTFGFVAVAWHFASRRAAERDASQEATGGSPTPASVPEWASAPAPLVSDARAATRLRFAAPRWAATLALTVLFFAGASFTAVAGDQAVQLFEGEAAVGAPALDATTPTTEAAPAEEPEVALEPEAAPAEVAPEPAPVAEAVAPVEAAPAAVDAAPAAEAAPAAAPAQPEGTEPESAPEPEPAHGAPAPAAKAETPKKRVEVKALEPQPARPQAAAEPALRQVEVGHDHEHEHETAELDPEATLPGVSATVWLHRELADPTPPSLRLSGAAASRLLAFSKREGALWELVLGVLRADGSRSMPSRARTIADAARLVSKASLGRDGWALALKETGRTAAADRAVALARYYRAVGLQSLVKGLLAREDELAQKVLDDERVTMYFGGREDVAAGRVDVRVLATVAYLAEAYGQVTVSSLVSGHRLYSRPGVVSAHVYGQAVDIAALAGRPIQGNSEPGGLTEQAVRDILLLPAEVRPRQLISLLGLGGPSFPLADHGDHIHVGF